MASWPESTAARWAALLIDRLPADPMEWRDPDFIRAEMDTLARMLGAWHAPEWSGFENLPEKGRVLCVGTHNGGSQPADMFATMLGFWRRFGVEKPAYGLAHDLVFKAPFVGNWAARTGAVPAHPTTARELLERDAAVLVYPGGDVDSFKPFRERHVVKFGGRKGFARIAIQTGAPIVPVISVGAHHTFLILTDGARLAARLGLKRAYRLEVLPLGLALPFGFYAGTTLPYLPAPSKIRLRALPPIEHGLPPEAAHDPEAVAALAERVRATMQAALDELVAEGGFGLRAWLRARWSRRAGSEWR